MLGEIESAVWPDRFAAWVDEGRGLDLDAVKEILDAVAADPTLAVLKFKVASKWQGQCRSEAAIECVRSRRRWPS